MIISWFFIFRWEKGLVCQALFCLAIHFMEIARLETFSKFRFEDA